MFTFICRAPLLRNPSGEKYGKTLAQKEALKTILSKVFTSYFPVIWRDFFWEPCWAPVYIGDSKVFVDNDLTPMFFLEVHDGEIRNQRRDETFAALFQQAMVRFFCEATTAYTAKFTCWADGEPYVPLTPDLLNEYLPFSMCSEDIMPPEGFCWWIV